MKILLVEDNVLLSDNITFILKNENYLVDAVADGEEGYHKGLNEIYDLVILDIMLPGLDGFTILESLRANGITTPILVISAKSTVEDKVRALNNGSDDYLTKPFASEELVARIRALIRRSFDASSGKIAIDSLTVDTNLREVTAEGKTIELTPKEYEILEFLAYNKNRVVSRISIGEHIWGESLDLLTMSNFIDVHVKNLRKKLEEAMGRKIIFTKRGNGFILSDKDCSA